MVYAKRLRSDGQSSMQMTWSLNGLIGRLRFWNGALVRILKDRKGREMKQATIQVTATARYEWPGAGVQPVGWMMS